MLRWRNLKIAGYFMAGFQSTILDNGSYDVNSYTGFPTSGQPSFCCAPGDQRQLELSVHCLIGTGTALARARQGSGPSLPSGLSDYPLRKTGLEWALSWPLFPGNGGFHRSWQSLAGMVDCSSQAWTRTGPAATAQWMCGCSTACSRADNPPPAADAITVQGYTHVVV